MKPCGMKVTHQNFLKYNLAFALPDESPIAEKINKGTPIRGWYSSHLTFDSQSEAGILVT